MGRRKKKGGCTRREAWTLQVVCCSLLLVLLLGTRPDAWDRSRSLFLSWQFSALSYIGYRAPFEQSWAQLGIGTLNPGSRNIMQTWKNTDGNHRAAWLAINPTTSDPLAATAASAAEVEPWDYHFLTDVDALAFLRAVDPSQSFAEDFGVLKLGAMKADFLRLIWLYRLRQINIEIAFCKNIEMTGFYHTILKFPDT